MSSECIPLTLAATCVYCLKLLEGLSVHCTTQLELLEFRGVSEVGFSSCAVLTYYEMSKYFVLESGAQSSEFGCKSGGNISIAEYQTNQNLNFRVWHSEI